MKINPVVSLISTLLISFGIIFLGTSNFQFQYDKLIPQIVLFENQVSIQNDRQVNESTSKIQEIETINEPNIEVSSEYPENEINQKIEKDIENLRFIRVLTKLTHPHLMALCKIVSFSLVFSPFLPLTI